MSTKVPIVKVKILEKLLFYLGFEAKRQSGSHVFYRRFRSLINQTNP
jgi:predicted RNA binding protein YcfA (HicA-like mRNA interferase family)